MSERAVEIVGYRFEASATDGRKEVSFTTKPEHRKIRGIFLSAEGDADLSKCNIEIRINNRNVVSYNEMQASLIQKTKYLSIDDVAWQTDIDVDTSTIQVIFTNGTNDNLKVNLNLIAERKW